MNEVESPDWVAPILSRLKASSPLRAQDVDLVRDLVGPPSEHRLGADLGDDGEENCRFLVTGWACRVRVGPWGGRLILDILLPGDPIGLSITPRPTGLYRVLALTRGATASASVLRQRLRDGDIAHARLADAVETLEGLRVERILNHMARLAGGTSFQAMGHLLLELRMRAIAAGLAEGARWPLLLTQDLLSEALGITPVQVNRVLGQFRREGLLILGPGWAQTPDPHRLAAAIGVARSEQ